jgi:hypothetical protein
MLYCIHRLNRVFFQPRSTDFTMAILASIQQVASLSTSTRQGVEFDGILDDTPVNVRRNRHGGLVPATGSEIQTSYGSAIVVSHWGGSCVLEILEYDDEFLFMTECPKDPEILDAPEFIATLTESANRSRDAVVSDLLRILVTLDGNPTRECLERIENIPVLTKGQFIMDFAPEFEFIGDVAFLCDPVSIERESAADRKARLRAERRAAKKLADEMLESFGIPDDIAEEIDAEFDMVEEFDVVEEG